MNPASDHKHSTPVGVVLMSISMMTIPLVDATAKYLSAAYSPLYISWARYVVACLVASRHDRAFSERVSFLASRSAVMFCVRCSIVAFRYGQASILAPLVYLELLGGAAIGFLVFGDVPDAYVWIGALTIIAGGLDDASAISSGTNPRT